MIERHRGNLLDADSAALVNTVNCVGIMGKGIALEFKKKFPENFKAYEQACQEGQVVPGRMFIVPTGTLWNPHYIINFPTKRHWKSKSRLEDIANGLKALVEDVKTLGIPSIALPPLGCGYGGLEWHVVGPMIERAFDALPDVNVLLYEPHASSPKLTPPEAKMTLGRAMLLTLMTTRQKVNEPFEIPEVHLLAYLLQRSGQPLRLRFQWRASAPWASNLERVLSDMEGSLIRYDQGQGSLWLQPNVERASAEFLRGHASATAQLEPLIALLRDSPGIRDLTLFGHLLWAAEQDKSVTVVPEAAIGALAAEAADHDVYTPTEIRLAWDKLCEARWLALGPSK